MSRLSRSLALAFFLCAPALLSAQTPTTTAIAISAAGAPVQSVAASSVITLTATVTSGGTPAGGGQVNFCDADGKFCTDIHLLATSQIATNGTATYKFIPGVGTHHYRAVYLGTNNASGSGSTASALTVTAPDSANAPTTTVLVPTGHPGAYTLTATVSGGLSLPPTGTVSFFDTTNANYLLGTATLAAGERALSLQEKSSISPGGTPITADFNGDGIPDFALLNGDFFSATGSVTIYLGKGDGTFTALPSVPTGNYSSFAVSADFNNDGKADLVVGGSAVNVFLGNGDGTFTLAPSTIVSGAGAIAAGDINHDGNEDLVVSSDGQIVTYLGKGDGTFELVARSVAIPGQSINLADVNGDGKLDLAVEYYSSAAYNPTNAPISDPPSPPLQLVTILLGNGDGTYGTGLPVDVETNNYLSLAAKVVIADFDADGNLDLALITADEPDRLLILFGHGDGNFAKPVRTPNLFYYNFAAVADFNQDGIADLAAFVQFPEAPESPDLITLYGNGDGTFTTGLTATDPKLPSSGFVADFNGDGYTDIAAIEGDGSISIYLTQFMATSTAAVTGVSIVGTGTHYADAQYAGEAPYLGSLSPAVPLTADTVPTTLALTAVPAAGITVGQSVTLTANLSPSTAQNHDATGIVTFSSNGTMLGTGNLTQGAASFTTSALTAGTDDLVATYPGDTNFRPSIARDLLYTVAPLKAQTITFPQPVSPVSVNSAPIALVASASSGLPVSFKLVSGPATLAGSVLSFTGLGTVVVAADQPGDAVYAPAPEVTRSILVTPPAIVTLTVAPALVFQLSPVTLTAAISPTGAATGGAVTFLDGTQPIGTASAVGGTATISLSNLPVGTHNITASWSGTAVYAGASSPTTTLTVEDFAVAFTPAQVTIVHGGTATLTLQLTPVGGPAMAGPISVSLSGEPTGSEMTVTPASIATGAGSGTVTVVIATPDYPTGPYARNRGGDGDGSSRVFLAVIVLGGLMLPFGQRPKMLRARSPWNSALLAIIGAALFLGAIGMEHGDLPGSGDRDLRRALPHSHGNAYVEVRQWTGSLPGSWSVTGRGCPRSGDKPTLFITLVAFAPNLLHCCPYSLLC